MPKILYQGDRYFEGSLQLRPYDEEVMRFIKNQMKKDGKVFISKIVEVGDGIDIYFSSQKFVRNLGSRLKKSFKGDLKVSRELFTRDRMTQRLVYRATVFFRLKPKEDNSKNNSL